MSLSTSSKNIILTNWHDAVKKSLDSIAKQISHASFHMYDPTHPERCLNHDCSLLCHYESWDGDAASSHAEAETYDSLDVCFVSWTMPLKHRQGRKVSLDDCNSIIYPSHFIEKQRFDNTLMILPSVEARVRKQKREHIDDWIFRLYEMFSVAVDEGQPISFSPTSLFDTAQCLACSLHHPTTPHASLDVRRCGFCLQHFHDECSKQMEAHIDMFRQNVEIQFPKHYDIEPGDLPVYVLKLSNDLVVDLSFFCFPAHFPKTGYQ